MALADRSVIGMLFDNKIGALYKDDKEADVSSGIDSSAQDYPHYASKNDINHLIPETDTPVEIFPPNLHNIQREDRFLLFGKEICFSEAEQRDLELKHYGEQVLSIVPKLFQNWYEQCGSMDAVLNDYPTFVAQYLHKLVLFPLYSQLGECEIFDISFSQYAQDCSDYSECENALFNLQGRLQEMQGQAQQVQATVRGTSSSFLGTAAGTIAGNIANNSQKHKAYLDKSVSSFILDAFNKTLELALEAHANLLNTRYPDYVVWRFDEDKSSGLFENALKYPQKREELLRQSFMTYPRNHRLLKYIFECCPDERKEILRAADRYYVEIGDAVEKVLSKHCPKEAPDLPALESVRARILAMMNDLGISESKTIDALERACIERLIDGYEGSNESSCKILIEKLEKYDANDKNKAPYFHALESRVEEIQTQEDRQAFNKIYLETDIRNVDKVSEAVSKIDSARRTECANEYIAALNACTEANIRKAQAYHSSNPIIKVTGSKMIWNLLTVNGTVLHPTLMEEPPTSGQFESIKKHTVDLSERVGGTAKSLLSKGGQFLKSVSSPNAAVWTCPKCKSNNSGKFCSECGQKRPEKKEQNKR